MQRAWPERPAAKQQEREAMSLLELSGVAGGYGPVQVLHGIDLAVEEGHVAVVLGANGAGKTTTLRAISGMISTTGGITFDGRSIGNRRPEAVAKMGIAHVPQGRGTFTELSVEDNLRIGAIGRRDNGIEADLERWYEVFPRLGERRQQEAGSMSGGEQQMLALARAMMSRPRLLLLDEPSLGLAPLVTRDLFARLGELNRQEGLTVLVVEQNANLALEVGHWGYVLETGRIAVQGPAAQLHDDESVRRAYLGF
jgi:branched-chain amino acid transport system ATP-binding protein